MKYWDTASEHDIDMLELSSYATSTGRGRENTTAISDNTAYALPLRVNFTWTFLGNVIYAACQWGMLVVLAKLGTSEMVGRFALGLTITAPVIMLTNLQLRAVQATDARRQYLFGHYLSLRLIMTALALLIIVGITYAVGYRWETALVILVVGLAKSFEAVSDVFYGLLQQHERMDRIAKSMMIKGPLSLVALSIGIYLTGSVLWGAVGLALVWLLVLVGYDVRSGAWILGISSQMLSGALSKGDGLAEVLRRYWLPSALGKLAWLALPLGIVMSLISLNTNIPRYFLERYMGESELGIFAAMAYLMVAGGMVVNALGQSASPRLAKYYASGHNAAFWILLFRLMGIGVLLGGAGVGMSVIFGREILTLLYRPTYAEYTDVFVGLMIAAGLQYVASFLGCGMTAARYFRVQMPLFALVAGISIMASLWLIPSNGLRGAAMVVVIANLVQAVGSLVVILYALRTSSQHIEGGLSGQKTSLSKSG